MLALTHNLSAVLSLILAIVGVLCICGGALRAWERDFKAAAVLVVVGVVILVVA